MGEGMVAGKNVSEGMVEDKAGEVSRERYPDNIITV